MWLQGWIKRWEFVARSLCQRLEYVRGALSAATGGHILWSVQVMLGPTHLFIVIIVNTLACDDSIQGTSNPGVEDLVEHLGISGAPSLSLSKLYLAFFCFIFRIY